MLEISGKRDPRGPRKRLQRRLPRPAGRFPQVSGLKIVVDPSRPVGERVISVLADGEPLDDKKIYKLATNDFMARGGDGYSMFNNVTRSCPPMTAR